MVALFHTKYICSSILYLSGTVPTGVPGTRYSRVPSGAVLLVEYTAVASPPMHGPHESNNSSSTI